MYYTGFADEASAELDHQIKATQELGWQYIETRTLFGKNLGTITDEEFDQVCAALENSGVKFNCYGSGIANWSCAPRSDEDFEASMQELRTAIPRMKKLGTDMVRGMSFKVAPDEQPDSPEIAQIIFAKLNKLVKECEENGILYLHENCMNYGGMSYEHTLKMLDNVKSDNFKLVYDTGNPVFTHDRRGAEPYAMQSSWTFYSNVKDFIHYVHIKDGVFNNKTEKAIFTFPGEGDGDVKAIVKDLLKNGYDGGFSMEPHMGAVFHEGDESSTPEERKYKIYIEYGNRFMKLVDEAKAEL